MSIILLKSYLFSKKLLKNNIIFVIIFYIFGEEQFL